MSDVARDLARATRVAAMARTPESRLAAALRLGDSDLALCRGGARVSEEEARSMLRRQRARGRRPSACAPGG